MGPGNGKGDPQPRRAQHAGDERGLQPRRSAARRGQRGQDHQGLGPEHGRGDTNTSGAHRPYLHCDIQPGREAHGFGGMGPNGATLGRYIGQGTTHPSWAIRTGSGTLRSARTEGGSPRRARTGPYASGTWLPGRPFSSLAGTASRSKGLPSVRMASISPRRVAIRPSRFGRRRVAGRSSPSKDTPTASIRSPLVQMDGTLGPQARITASGSGCGRTPFRCGICEWADVGSSVVIRRRLTALPSAPTEPDSLRPVTTVRSEFGM